MKMKKSTWLLLVLAIAAIFLVAGCAPTAPTNGEEPNGEEPPPTPPPADTACPKVVKTEVSKLFPTEANDYANFQIKITFDENFSSSCIENPAFWEIEVANPGRVTSPVDAIPVSITVSGKVVTVRARVEEVGETVVIVDDYEELFEAIALALEDGDVDAVIAALEDLIAALGRLDEDSYDTLIATLDEAAFGDLVDALGCLATAATAATAAEEEDLAAALENLAEGLGGDEMAQNALIAALEDLVDALEGASHLALVTLLESDCVEGLIDALEDLIKHDVVFPSVEVSELEFPGLICNKEDADDYKEIMGKEVKFADEVSWKLTNCAVYDELGNVCCDFEDEACCVEPYCEECPEEGCDLTEPGACL